MTPHGEKCLPEMNPETFRIDSYILQLLQQDPLIYANFLAFPRLYRHVRLDTIQLKKPAGTVLQAPGKISEEYP